jgi:hypothetical protein
MRTTMLIWPGTTPSRHPQHSEAKARAAERCKDNRWRDEFKMERERHEHLAAKALVDREIGQLEFARRCALPAGGSNVSGWKPAGAIFYGPTAEEKTPRKTRGRKDCARLAIAAFSGEASANTIGKRPASSKRKGPLKCLGRGPFGYLNNEPPRVADTLARLVAKMTHPSIKSSAYWRPQRT